MASPQDKQLRNRYLYQIDEGPGGAMGELFHRNACVLLYYIA
jgi:hypothetical protein